ncbi:MAG: MBL fold metallo-hydrolase [Firmicutes bacterium]|nr:MBL fold metallo-hydrolase [Bacillota bacterium]
MRTNNRGFRWFAILFTFVSILSLGFVWTTQIENFINKALLGYRSSPKIQRFENGLAIHFVNIGQGDATVIQTPTGEVILVDAGNQTPASRHVLSNYLKNEIFKNQAERTINLFIATHSHADHIGSASYLLENYDVAHIIRPKSFTPTEIASNVPYLEFGIEGRVTPHNTIAFQQFIHSMSQSNALIEIPRKGKEIQFGNVVIRFFSPTTAFYGPDIGKVNYHKFINQLSTVFTVSYSGRRVLFMGDAYTENELRLLNYRCENGLDAFGTLPDDPFKVDVLDVGHHGSNTSTSTLFLNKIRPSYAILQLGRNHYGHPHSEVIGRLESIDANILITRQVGHVLVQIDTDGRLIVQTIPDSNQFWVNYWMIFLPILLTPLLFISIGKVVKRTKVLYMFPS